MDKTEFQKQKQLLKDAYDKGFRELKEKYALTNNNIKIGDIISDTTISIKVEKIQVIQSSFGNEYPECRYSGKKVKKDGSFFKDGSSDSIYQSNLKKINGIEVKNEN